MEGEEQTLPDRLRAATRLRHRDLNAQVTTRLPLCLPPHANSPLVYAKGMIVFGQIYVAFEKYLEAPPDGLTPKMMGIYRTLNLPQLSRTTRLQHDIASLKLRLSHNEAAELDLLANASKEFGRRVEISLSARPHNLLAYAYTMYLALFNGGRWIREQLLAAGNEFWKGEETPLSFWDFDDTTQPEGNDEGLKKIFKSKLLEVSLQLTEDEQQDVVEEAIQLYDLCTDMIVFLDGKTAT